MESMGSGEYILQGVSVYSNGGNMRVFFGNDAGKLYALDKGMCGDVNCDGKVTMSDVRKVFNRYLDPNYPLDSPWAADVNGDGKVSMPDVRKVFNRYLDPGYELNCCCEV
jgi:hypothetical protein